VDQDHRGAGFVEPFSRFEHVHTLMWIYQRVRSMTTP
jgi:hypothetical protein